MVGIIIVSHSWKLAHEIIEFCNEMKKDDFEIINASGLDNKIYGSNPIKIKEEIEKSYKLNTDGVIIFCDIGSSIINTKMAIDLIDENFDKSKIIIADAPIVEGTLIASAMNGNSSLNIIIDELKQLKEFDKLK